MMGNINVHVLLFLDCQLEVFRTCAKIRMALYCSFNGFAIGPNTRALPLGQTAKGWGMLFWRCVVLGISRPGIHSCPMVSDPSMVADTFPSVASQRLSGRSQRLQSYYFFFGWSIRRASHLDQVTVNEAFQRKPTC